jgi:hypothetical protein
LNWRKNNPVIANGKTLHFAPFNGLYVYFRYNKDKMVMVVLNKNDKEVMLDTKRFDEILHDKSSASEIISHESFDLKKPVPLKAKTAVVFEVK